MYFKKKHKKKKKNREKWSPDPTSGSTRKRFFLTPSETEAMYAKVRQNINDNITVI